MYTKLFGLLFSLGIGLAVCQADASARSDKSPPTQMSEGWWRQRFMEKQVELHKPPAQLLFLGDSILHSFEWNPTAPVWKHWYAGRAAVDLGFNGDVTTDVIWRVEHGELDGPAPKLVVILIGTNDIGKRPPAEITKAIAELVQAVKDRAAATRILVLGILPTGRPAAEEAASKEVNASLSALYSRPGAIARYQDVSCVFLHHGQLDTALFREHDVPGVEYPLHPTLHGMDLLAARIEPIVAAVLGDLPRSTTDEVNETDCPAGN